MKRQFILSILIAASVSGSPVFAETEEGYYTEAISETGYYETNARVINVEPIYEVVKHNVPVRECWTESGTTHYNRYSNSRSVIGGVVGGIVGGVIGNQFGRGRGKTAATIIGSLSGATLGHQVARHKSRPSYNVEHCEMIDRQVEQEHVAGYRVTYLYRGKAFVTRTEEHPGDYIRLQVEVEPI